MNITQQKLAKLVIAMSASFLLVACSSGGDSTPAAPTTNTITGTVTAPGGAVASLEQQTLFAKMIDFVLPGAVAMITGTVPVPSATVELIKFDDNGSQLGGVLASAMTDAGGNYSLSTTESMTSNLVVRVQGSDGATLRALVVSATADIDPVSEYAWANASCLVILSGSFSRSLTRMAVILSKCISAFLKSPFPASVSPNRS